METREEELDTRGEKQIHVSVWKRLCKEAKVIDFEGIELVKESEKGAKAA